MVSLDHQSYHSGLFIFLIELVLDPRINFISILACPYLAESTGVTVKYKTKEIPNLNVHFRLGFD